MDVSPKNEIQLAVRMIKGAISFSMYRYAKVGKDEEGPV
jgi:hypothetical protein